MPRASSVCTRHPGAPLASSSYLRLPLRPSRVHEKRVASSCSSDRDARFYFSRLTVAVVTVTHPVVVAHPSSRCFAVVPHHDVIVEETEVNEPEALIASVRMS